MPLFTTLDPERLMAEIRAARSHVILAASGVSIQIAETLIKASESLQPGAVQVVLDVSAQVARLGFGDHDAVEKMTAAGISLHNHPGLRIGVLICDDRGWSYAPSPRLVEDEPTANTDAFNAIVLTTTQMLELRGELPALVFAGTERIAPTQRHERGHEPLVGIEPVTEATLSVVRKALEIAPAQPLDLARRTQVYTALIEFVELKFEGFNVQSRRVQLPKSLPLIASTDRVLKARLTASLKVLEDIEKPVALRENSESLEVLRDAYLIPVGAVGRVMLKSKRNSFEAELRSIEESLDRCRSSLADGLKVALKAVVDGITPELARAVLLNPPPHFRGRYEPTQSHAEEYVREELTKALPNAEKLVQGMKIYKFYKDVTYATLKNKEFVERVQKVIPKSTIEGALLAESLAVAARSTTEQV